MNRGWWGVGLVASAAQYIVGSAAWIYFAFGSPRQISAAADWSYIPAYRWFFHEVVGAAPVPWALAVAAGELGLGTLILARRRRTLGLATAFQVFLAGVDGPAGVVNLAIAAGQLVLLRHDARRLRPNSHPGHHGLSPRPRATGGSR